MRKVRFGDGLHDFGILDRGDRQFTGFAARLADTGQRIVGNHPLGLHQLNARWTALAKSFLLLLFHFSALASMTRVTW